MLLSFGLIRIMYNTKKYQHERFLQILAHPILHTVYALTIFVGIIEITTNHGTPE